MAEYTNDHIEIEELPKGISVDGIGDICPEDGDNVNVPLMKNGEPYPAHVPPEDPEMLNNPYCPDTGTESDDSYEEVRDWDDDDDGEGSSCWDDEEATATESDPRDRFLDFASVSATLFNSICSALPDKKIKELEFTTTSGGIGAHFSIRLW